MSDERTGPVLLTPDRYDAVLFDMDGVVTDTARLHAAAWAETFDGFLRRRASDGASFVPFSDEDYRSYVDGRPRLDGVRAFLAARGVALPEGAPDDPPGADTVHGLASAKARRFLALVQDEGVRPYGSTMELIRRLRAAGVRTALVTASRNRELVMAAAGVDALFDATIDGHDRAALALRGKPAPDTYLEAAQRLKVSPSRAVVVEDATSGVEAGRAGGFGFVIGVDRTGAAEELQAAGADAVVPDLACIEVGPRDPWVLVYDEFDPAVQTRRETLLALGNGYFVTRGAAAEARAADGHYPGTYLAGGYNRLVSSIGGQPVEHEDLVNMPNWLPLTFRVDDGPWFRLDDVEVLSHMQSVDIRHGVYLRSVRARDAGGRVTRFIERRLVHMADCHLAAQQLVVIAENWTGRLTVQAMLDGDVTNAGVLRYRSFESRHVRVTRTGAPADDVVLLEAETTQSAIRVAMAARISLVAPASEGSRRVVRSESAIGHEVTLDVGEGQRVELEKVVALFTSRDRASAGPATDAVAAARRADGFEDLLATHAAAWEALWRRCDVDAVEVDEDAMRRTHLVVRLHVFHLLQTASPHTMELDAGIPARGWHGEAYRGHVFWDELFIFPYLCLRMPLLARSLLLYRYRRLPEAQRAARAAGYRGAMYPWQSGSTGREETDVVYYNPRGDSWIRDDTHLQRHVGAAVAYNIWKYHQATWDDEFLHVYGAEMMLEIARFWASIATWNGDRERYDIRGVVGPDEFHVRYPGRDEPGLDNNTYTNVMAAWCLTRALDVLARLSPDRSRELRDRLALADEELARWDDVSRRLHVPFLHEGIPAQFEGYDRLREFDWEGYRARYGSIGRLDLILDAEGDSPEHYKLSKQADVLMLFYLFSTSELEELFERLGYAFDGAMVGRSIDYYLARSSEGSTLSGVVHAWVLAREHRERSWPLFLEALRSDIDDIQGGTTPEGIHLGAMAGTVDILQRCYTGMELRDRELRFDPVLPDELERLSFRIRYCNHWLDVDLVPTGITVASTDGPGLPIRVTISGQRFDLHPGERAAVTLAGS